MFRWLYALFVSALAVGCSGEDAEETVDPADTAEPADDAYDFEARGRLSRRSSWACNPVDEAHCLLPYPSSFFLVEDTTAASGLRVDFAADSLPVNVSGNSMSLVDLNRKDGFSTLGALYAYFEGPLSDSLRVPSDIAESITESSETMIVHAASGERVPHFREIELAAEGSGRQLLLLRPMAPLRHGQRYVVGIRNIKKADETLASAPDGFATLRDRVPTEDADLGRQRSHYENDIFPVLESAGMSRSELQLAWDFNVASAESSTDETDHMRELADNLGPPSAFTVSSVDEFD